MDDAAAAVANYIEHRRQREAQIVAAVAAGARTPRGITEAVYFDVGGELIPAAVAQVKVQLEKLIAEGRLTSQAASAEEMRVVLPDEGD